MKTYFISIFVLFLLVCSCNLLSNKETEQLKKDNEQLKKDNEQLKKDVDILKKNSNQTSSNSQDDTKRYPIKKNQTENNMSKYQTQKNNSNSSGNCSYWITSSSHKRHNSSCRWYKNSNGYCTDDPNEGIACKICGG